MDSLPFTKVIQMIKYLKENKIKMMKMKIIKMMKIQIKMKLILFYIRNHKKISQIKKKTKTLEGKESIRRKISANLITDTSTMLH